MVWLATSDSLLFLNLDLKCFSTIEIALSPVIRINAIAPTPWAVARAIIVSFWYVLLVEIFFIFIFYKDTLLFWSIKALINGIFLYFKSSI